MTLAHSPRDIEVIRETKIGSTVVRTVKRGGNYLIRPYAVFTTIPTSSFVQHYKDFTSISSALHHHGSLEREMLKLLEARARR